jgi:hypothetical protein
VGLHDGEALVLLHDRLYLRVLVIECDEKAAGVLAYAFVLRPCQLNQLHAFRVSALANDSVCSVCDEAVVELFDLLVDLTEERLVPACLSRQLRAAAVLD